MALLVVLAILALVSVLVLAFFSQATLNRQTSFASAGQARAEDMAETALQSVVGDLREEIRAGSTNPPTESGSPLYFPSTNINMLPQRVADTGLTNLIKESAGASNSWFGPAYAFDGPIRSIAGNSTTNRSANGRYLPTIQWLRPQLLASSETNSFRPPDWVLLTRQGPLTNAPAVAFSTLTNNAAANLNYVIGRYAYTVYDIGGLLDANVAGYSSSGGLSASDIARKGSLGLVSLAGIGGLTQAQVDALVAWRTAGAYTNFSSYAGQLGSINGFLYPASGNQGFFTRQDLISYATNNGISEALPYLTSFSREKNAPSWSPATPTGSSIGYAALAETVGSTNRDLANLRGTNGVPLIKSRFDLDRLAWLTYKGPSADLPSSDPLYNPNGTDANIRTYFGLAWDTTAFSATSEHGQEWVYVSPDGGGGPPFTPSMIKTLDQVAANGREPDFFELLKAGILSGSLGLYSSGETGLATLGGTSTNALAFRTNSASNSPLLFNQVADYQIFDIGANIMGQYSSDGYPPLIQSPGGNSVGVKSLPYLFAAGQDVYRPSSTVNRTNVWYWLRFVIWNPHRNATVLSTNAGPTQFQIAAVNGTVVPYLSKTTYVGKFPNGAGPTNNFLLNPVSIVFTNSTNFIDPTPLMLANMNLNSTGNVDAQNGTAADLYSDTGTGRTAAGIYLGKQMAPDGMVSPTYAGITNYQVLFSSPTNQNAAATIDLRFRYQDWQGNWRSYQMPYNMLLDIRGWDDSLTNGDAGPNGNPYTNSSGTAFAVIQWAYPDPRDRRLGLTQDHVGSSDTNLDDGTTNTFRSSSTATFDRVSIVHQYTSGSSNSYTAGPVFFNVPTTQSRQFPAYYADNSSTSPSYYKDPDGVLRPGDANKQPGINPSALNSITPNNPARPLVLNAPFHSIGDLGYTYRDLPWKTLDFFSTNSADAGLLDLFGQYGGVTNDLPVVGGKVNLNSAPAPILQALLSGAAFDFNGDLATVGANTNTAADLAQFMSALRPTGSAAPIFLNKAALVPFFATNMPSTYLVKGQREAPVRALANVVQTRTWNLLIDVVAQAGHYAPGATGIDAFTVEGEKHYWLQIAIDRFTGEIVDQEMEPVYEQ